MLARGFEERVIPLERREILCGALVVEEIKELALRVVARKQLRLRAGMRGKEKKKNRSSKKKGKSGNRMERKLSHADAEKLFKLSRRGEI
jgi:hypothetical protein